MPDVSRTDPAVQAQVRDSYDLLHRLIDDRGTPLPDLASAYGRFGMLLQAAQFFDVAEASYRNAQSLAPAEMRWPYYLGHLYRSQGQLDRAADAFTRAQKLQPDDLATLDLARTALSGSGETRRGDPLVSRRRSSAHRNRWRRWPVWDASRWPGAITQSAADRFEAALAIDPQSESLHAPLAAAYRGLGQIDKAQPHLRQWRNTDILLPDPLQQELDLVLESGLSYELRGVRALDSKNYAAAADFFRRGLSLAQPGTPLRRSLQHKLGTALFAMGKVDEAHRAFLDVVDVRAGRGHRRIDGEGALQPRRARRGAGAG